jgi:hypothetical protein
MYLPKLLTRFRGQTLISVLISLGLFAILSHAMFTLISSSYSITSFNRARTVAKNLAEEKMEEIRNMPYNSIGTVGGIPAGVLPQTQTFSLNGLNYTIKISVVYIDDPFDQQAPNDLLPTDYKRARVDISWVGLAASGNNPVTLISDIAPSGIETTATGGTLSILVFDANAQPLSQADVTIVATTTNPQINLTLKSDVNGRVILPGAPVCKKACYQISVTKAGYSTDRTYSTSEVTNPAKPMMTVLTGQLSEASFAIDKLGSLDVYSTRDRTSNFEALPNITFNIRGDKTIGTDSDDNLVYTYQITFTTDSSGYIAIPNLEWDNYTISVTPTSGWDISGANPIIPVGLLPAGSVNFTFALSQHTSNSVLISFTNPANVQIASVSARLYNKSGFEATSSSGISGNPDFGQVFFSSLESKIYQLVASASGFLQFNGNVDVAGYKQEKVIMTPQ